MVPNLGSNCLSGTPTEGTWGHFAGLCGPYINTTTSAPLLCVPWQTPQAKNTHGSIATSALDSWMGESGVTERLEGVDERDSPSVVDVTLRVSGAFGSCGVEAAPPSSLLPSPPPERWEPMEMIRPVLVNPTKFAATLR